MLDSSNSRILVADCGPNFGRTIMAETVDSALWLLKQCRFEQLWVGDYLLDGSARELCEKAAGFNCLPLEISFVGMNSDEQEEVEDFLLAIGYSLSKGTTSMYVKNVPRICQGTRDWAEFIDPPLDIRVSP